ncbi:MAG: thiamine pyrophosphate-requiring protein [Pseudomonadota bacterium]|nr:thiamine pyrophosphate-requiring protein [Pseudomonadota bacterium]
MNGAEAIAEILKKEGTEFIACYPRNPVIEAVAKLGIQPIISRQERVGIGIADGYTRQYRGKKNGVFAAQAGPGIENAFPGIAQAFSENVPILILSGGAALSQQYRRPTFRAAEVLKPVTKWSVLVHTANEIPEAMRRAYHALRTGKGGPVLVEVAQEVWTDKLTTALEYNTVVPLRIAPDPSAIEKAASMLLSAEKPLLWAGQGIFYAEAFDQLRTLAELIPAPVMTTNPGKSALAENHPLSLGASTRSRPGALSSFLEKADLICALGSSLTKTPFGPGIPKGTRIIHATNEAADINKDYYAEHALIGDAGIILDSLIQEIKSRRKTEPTVQFTMLSNHIHRLKKDWLNHWSTQMSSDEIPINQYRIIRDLMYSVDRDDVVITHDSGGPREQLLPFWETTVPGSYIGWGKSTQLGYGLGLIIGAKLAEPEKTCINVMGDSAIGMTGMDLETAARYKIGTLTIIFNNGMMAAERDVLIEADKKYGALEVGGNYTQLAKALGVEATRVEQPKEFIPALKMALQANKENHPYLIECIVKEGREFSRDNVRDF